MPLLDLVIRNNRGPRCANTLRYEPNQARARFLILAQPLKALNNMSQLPLIIFPIFMNILNDILQNLRDRKKPLPGLAHILQPIIIQ